jgi:hypothetical protein
MKKHMADPNTDAIKIVIRKTKNCPALRCKPVIKYAIEEKIIDGKTRIGNTSQRSLERKNVEIR